MRLISHFAALFTFVFAAIALAEPPRLGKPVADFKIENVSGGAPVFELAKNKGKIVVLFFWRTTDSASIEAIPTVNEIYKDMSRSGIIVVGISGEEREKVEPVATGKGVQFPFAFGAATLIRDFEIASFPNVLIVDPAGNLAWRGHPADDLKERIKTQRTRTPPIGSESKTLNNKLKKSEAALGKGQIGRAYTLAKSVKDVVENGTPLSEQSKALMDKAEEAAKKAIEEIKQDIRAGKNDEACRRLADLSTRFSGQEVARLADEEVARMRADNKTKNVMKKAIDNARGEMRNDEAEELAASSQFLEAVEAYKEVTEKYADTDAALEAKKAMEHINSDAGIQQKIKAARDNEEAERWLDLAERFEKCDLKDQAKVLFEKIVSQHPKTLAASRAKKKLEELK
ncbi:MAG: redoxin domain-containing protein [Phycisphaerales bacterium]|nr:redoxin domain-containing protein [Phycisphaerales bacterium]